MLTFFSGKLFSEKKKKKTFNLLVIEVTWLKVRGKEKKIIFYKKKKKNSSLLFIDWKFLEKKIKLFLKKRRKNF